MSAHMGMGIHIGAVCLGVCMVQCLQGVECRHAVIFLAALIYLLLPAFHPGRSHLPDLSEAGTVPGLGSQVIHSLPCVALLPAENGYASTDEEISEFSEGR